jgi:hypothetical protein
MTGGGVTAGIDFGLVLLSHLRDEETAKQTELLMEYAPKPPFNTGRPDLAGPALTELVRGGLGPLNMRMLEAATDAVRRLG